MTNERTEFLLARVAEDEEVARETLEGEKVLGHDPASRTFDLWGSARPGLIAVMAKPSRVLAECEAKRRIIADVWEWRHAIVDDCWYTCPAATEEREGETCCDENAGDECNCGADWRRDRILWFLVQPYVNHPDFQEKWNL